MQVMHRGFDLPNADFNGRHRIDIRLYARTPIGAKNMVVDEAGSRFRQFDMAVDGLSYFSMPAVFELGTAIMWEKVSRFGMARLDSSRGEEGASYDDERAFSENEYRSMQPQTESEEDFMMKTATEASLKDWEKRADYGKISKGEMSANGTKDVKPSKRSRSHAKYRHSANNLAAIGEDNLIDFGTDEVSSGAPHHINLLERGSSDLSALDDDATTASFMMNTAMPMQQPPPIGAIHNTNQRQSSHFTSKDPTFFPQHAQQPWSSVGSLSTPRNNFGSMPSSDMSFAVPPAPTLDDYNDAFGGSAINTGSSVISGPTVTVNHMYPVSPMSVGMGSPGAHAAQQLGMQQRSSQMASQQQWQRQPFGSPGGPRSNDSFDPFQADPFAS